MNYRPWSSAPKLITRLLAAFAVALTVLAIPGGATYAGEPTLTKSLSQTQPFANADGTFPSGSTVTYEVSIGCNAPGDCDNFELHDFSPEFTDVFGNPAVYEFVSASPGGAGPDFDIDTSDPEEIILSFPDGFSAGTSMNIQLTFTIPPNVTPDNTTATNTAIWGEFDADGDPLPNTVTDTQDVTSRAQAGFEVVKTGPTTVNPNQPVEFVVALCGDNPDDPEFGPLIGTVENATLTDTIPDGFVIVDTGGGTDNGDGTVSWDLGDVQLGAGECEERTITLEYPSAGPLDGPVPSVNVVVAGGDFPPGEEPPEGAEFPFVVDNPQPGDPGIDKTNGRPFVDLDLTDGAGGADDGDSFSSYFLQPQNIGEGVILDAVLTDPIPDRFAVTRIDSGTWPAGPTGPNDNGLVEFVVEFQDGTSQSFFADGVTDVSFAIPDDVGNPLVLLTVNYGELPAGWEQDGGAGRTELYGYFIDPGRSGGDPIDFDDVSSVPVTNTATLSGTVLDPNGDPLPERVSDEDSATIRIESPQPHPAVFKSVDAEGNTFGNGVFPSDDSETTTLTWTVTVLNHPSGTAAYPDPVVVDLLPTLAQNLLGEGGLSDPYDYTISTPASVTCPPTPADGGTVPNAGTGLDDSVLIWECTGDLDVNERITITFKTDVEAGTPPQSVLNRDYTTTNALTDDGAGQYFSEWDGGPFFGEWQEDTNDLDGDGDTTDRIRTDFASIDVLDFVFLNSVKEVRGGADAECNNAAFPPAGEDNTTFGSDRCTRPGDTIDYQMTVKNDGNVDIFNLMLMDIFPAVGDTFVVPNQNTGAVAPRNSAFDTNLIGPVTSADPNVVIEYSIEAEPCRYDDFYPLLAGNATVPGCSPANWSTTPPSPISSAKAIRITYIDPATGDPAVLPLGEEFQLEWPMRASVAAQTDEIATNAFGWSAQSTTSNTVNTAGPAPVDISVAELEVYLLGDQVWYDTNYDGTQDEAPLVGVPQVPVAVFLDSNGNGVLDANDTFVQETVTDSAAGFEGEYLFSALPEGDYFVAFAPPSDWVVSPAFQGGDTAVDSNGTEDTAFPTTLWDPASVNGPLYDDIFVSDIVNLGPANTSVDAPNDLTIDLGLWRPDPSIDIEKATNAADADNPVAIEDADTPTGQFIPEGELVTWSYVVTNTGNTVLDNVTITDDSGTPADPADDLSTPVGITCPLTSLQPDESMTCTSTVPAPAVAGQYTNTADVVGDPVLPDIPWSEESFADLVRLDGSPFYDADGNIIPVVDEDPSNYFGAVATIDIEKSTNGVPADAVGTEPAGPVVPTGDPVQWTYEVTIPAPGNVALADVTITDDNGTPADPTDDLSTANGDFTFVGGDADGDGLLDVDETWTYTADAPDGAILGIYENSADVIGTPVTPDGTPILNPDGTPMEQPVDDDPSHYYGIAVPGIDIEKSTNGIPADLPGDDPAGPEILAGSDVTWTYVIENTGNVDLLITGFNDDQLGPITACVEDDAAATPVFPVTLAPDDTVTCTVTAPNGAAIGLHVNIADVTGTPLDPDGNPITENETPDGPVPVEPPEDDDPSNYTGIGEPGIDIVKVTDGSIWNAITQMFDPVAPDDGILVTAGEEVTWTYTVTNTGDFALANVVVNDDNGTPAEDFDDFSTEDGTIVFVEGDVDGDGLLDLDEVWVFEATGTGNFGNYANDADTTGIATDPNGTPIVDQDGNDPFVDEEGNSTIVADDPSSYEAGGEPGIAIDKVTDGSIWNPATGMFDPVAAGDGIVVTAGQAVNWTYTVTNTGDFALADVAVNDDNGTPADDTDDFSTADGTIVFVDGDVDGDGLLDVDEIWVFSADGIAILGDYVNGADTVGVATDPDGTPIVGQDGNDPFVDENGDSTIVDDDPSDYSSTANPGVDIEKTTNGFQADDPAGDQTDPNNTVPFVELGDSITWEYVITNTGDTALLVEGFSDDQIVDVSTLCTEGAQFPVTLQPLETVTCTVVDVATQQAGDLYVNVAVVTPTPVDVNGDPIVDPDGNDPFVDPETGEPTVTDEDPSAYFGADPGIDLEKATNGFDADTGTGPFVAQGGQVTWTYVVTNTGNTDLADLTITDSIEGEICTIDFLAVGDVETCELVLAESTLVGQYENNSVVSGQPVDQFGNPIVDPETGLPVAPIGDSDPSHYFGAAPAIDVEKSTNGEDADTGTGPFIPLGDGVEWTYVVTNTGNVPLTGIVVTDNVIGEICTIPLLLPGDSETCTFAALAEQANQYENIADVVGTPSFPIDPNGDPNDPDNYTPIVDPETGEPLPDVVDEDPSHYYGVDASVDIEKSTNGEDADGAGTGPVLLAGDAVTWEYVVTNTGNAVLLDVVVNDNIEGEICVIAVLLVGDTATCTAEGVAGTVGYQNVGTVTGTPAVINDPDADPNDPDSYTPTGTDPVADEDPSNYDVLPVAVLPESGELPTTGSNGTSPLLFAGFGLLLAGLALLIGTRARREREFGLS